MSDVLDSSSFSESSENSISIELDESLKKNSENLLIKSVNKVMKIKYENHISYTTAEKFALELNSQTNSSLDLYTNKTLLIKHCEKRYFYDVYVCCKICNEWVNNGSCSRCEIITKKRKHNFIINIPVKQQIINVLNEHFEVIIEYEKKRQNIGSDVLNDIHDGTVYKSLKNKHPNVIILPFTLSTDGAQLQKSNKKTLWAIQFLMNFLPPSIRYKKENILITTLYFDVGKPDFLKIFHFIAQEFDNLFKSKINMYREGEFHEFLPHVTFCLCDLQARAPMLGIKNPVGFLACPICLQIGASSKEIKQNNQNNQQSKSTTVRYIKEGTSSELRTHDGMLKAIKHLHEKKAQQLRRRKINRLSNDGVIAISPMITFHEFDMINGFPTDYMHNILLGVTKQLLFLWTSESSKHNIGNQNKKILNDRIVKLKPYDRIERKPRSLDDLKLLKANELKNLLLFYLRYSLVGCLKHQLIEHFELLSASTYILLKSEISFEEIETASDMLVQFADDYEKYYGQISITMNVHLLRHYGVIAKSCGPLWSQSMFPFESNIENLSLASKGGNTDQIENIANSYCFRREKKTTEKNTLAIKHMTVMRNKWKNLLQENGFDHTHRSLLFGTTLHYRNQIFKSSYSRITQRTNNYVKIITGEIGSAEIYFQYEGNIYVILEKFKVIRSKYHLNEVISESVLEIFKCEHILQKLLYLKYDTFEIMTSEPNHFEK